MIKNSLKHTSTSYCSAWVSSIIKIYAGLSLNFRRWSGVNSMTGKPSVVITALVFMYENDGTVESQVKARSFDNGFLFYFSVPYLIP